MIIIIIIIAVLANGIWNATREYFEYERFMRFRNFQYLDFCDQRLWLQRFYVVIAHTASTTSIRVIAFVRIDILIYMLI